MTRPTRSPHSARPTSLIACAIAVLLTLGACGGESRAGDLLPGAAIALPATSALPQTVTTDPPVEPPESDPPVGPPATVTPDTTADDDGTDWLPIVLLIGAGVILLVAIVAIATRRKPTPEPRRRANPTPTAPVASPQSDLLSTAQWIHDQLSLELLASTPTTATARWSTERFRLDNVAIGAQQQFALGNGETWQSLAQITSVLATAIDTSLQLRAQVPSNAQLIAESTDVVNRHRGTLQQVINALWPTVRR